MPFDFDSFVAGTNLARDQVSVYGKDHATTIARLQSEHDALPDTEDERESSGSTSRQSIAEQIRALRDEMEQSRQDLTLRTLGPDEYQTVVGDESLDIYDRVALQTQPPKDSPNPAAYNDLPNLTADQVRRLAGVIGAGQWANVRTVADDLISHKVAVPDFSQTVSQTLSRGASSKS